MGAAASLVCSSAVSGVASNALNVYAASVTQDADGESYSSDSDGTNAVLVDGRTVTLTDPTVTKTGDSSSENADFDGTNAAVLARNGAQLSIEGGSVTSSGQHANGIFSTGSGTTVNVSNTQIRTSGDNSGGIMTTQGATMNASDLDVATSGNSSAAIRSDRGGGDVNVSGGSYSTDGVGSPAIYSTADIDVENASLSSAQSEGIVIEGANSVNLQNCTLDADNTALNGQAQTYQGIMIYQSMSGDADSGTASFSATGGSIQSENGALLYVTNTSAAIQLNDVDLENASEDLLVIQQGPWGSEGSNGGSVTMNTVSQTLEGNITVDSISSLNLEMDDTSYSGAINTNGSAGPVYVAVPEGSTWTLTGDSYITSLSCTDSSIDLNGYTLYIDGDAYTEGTAMEGSEVNSVSAQDAGNQNSGDDAQDAESGQAPSDEKAPDGSAPAAPADGQKAPDSDNAAAPADDSEGTSDEETDSSTFLQPLKMFRQFLSRAEQIDTGDELSQLIAGLESSDDGDGLYTIDDILRIAETICHKSADSLADMDADKLIAQAENDGLIDADVYSKGTEQINLDTALEILEKASDENDKNILSSTGSGREQQMTGQQISDQKAQQNAAGQAAQNMTGNAQKSQDMTAGMNPSPSANGMAAH